MTYQQTIFGEELELTDQQSSAEDFPASRFPWLESKKAKGTTVISGRKCSELSESLRRVGSSVRMYLESCALPLTTFVRTWSISATKSGYLILKLRLSERRTGESESRLWATPNTMDFLPARSPDAMAHMLETARKGRSGPSNLREQVDPTLAKLFPTPTASVATHGGPNQRDSSGRPGLQMAAQMWRTPGAEDAVGRGEYKDVEKIKKRWEKHQVLLCQQVKMWPTPTTRDYKDGSAQSCANVPVNGLLGRAVHMLPTPTSQMAKHADPTEWEKENRPTHLHVVAGGQLNPTWVEWLMGFPLGWTDLNASETP